MNDNTGLTKRQKEIVDKIMEKWDVRDIQPIDAKEHSVSLLVGVIGAVLHDFVHMSIPPTLLMDSIVNASGEHIAGLLVTLVHSDIITMGEAREMIAGSGDALESKIGKALTRLYMAWEKDDDDEESQSHH